MKLFTLPLIIKMSKSNLRLSEVISEGRSTRFGCVMIFEAIDFIFDEGVKKSDYIYM